MLVIKRDGIKVDFNKIKIANAILKAYAEVDGIISDEAKNVSNTISTDIENSLKCKCIKEISVEDIQNMVENELMSYPRKDVARSYINYRYMHGIARNQYKDFMNAITEKLMAKNVANQNANVDEHSFGGRIGEATDLMMREYALNYCMSDMAKNNHLNNEIYEHDLNAFPVGSHNCMSIPFDDLLKNGFKCRQTDVRPAQSVNTAFQLIAVIFQIQSLQQFGGVSATHLDWTMVPYVRKSFFKHYLTEYLKSSDEFNDIDLINIDENELDEWVHDNKAKYLEIFNLKETDFTFGNMNNLDKRFAQAALYETRKEIYQAVEGMYHNLNTLQSRSGNQLPFSSINYGTCTSLEGRMVTKAILDVLYKGIGRLHKTSIFPCGIYQCMKGINRKPGDPNYDLYRLALKCTAKRLYPNYANCDWSGNSGYDPNDPRTFFSTMGKRKLQPI